MISPLVLALALLADPVAAGLAPFDGIDKAVAVPGLIPKAELAFLVQRWDRAIELYQQIVEANPTVGLHWWRLGTALLEAGQPEQAIPAFTKAEELGAFQWGPPRMVYRGEIAWGLAAAHARAGHRDEALRWTRISLDQGLRDIRGFRGKHFESLANDSEFQTLVWATDVKGLSRDEGRRHDLRFLMHEAKRIHFAPFRAASEQSIDELAAAIDRDIPQLSDDELLVRMMGLVRRFGDGHTSIRRRENRERLPVQFFQFPEGLFITSAVTQHADLVGAKVLRIGPREAADAVAKAADISSRDNSMNVTAIAPKLLTSLPILRGLGLAANEGPVTIEVEDVGGQIRIAALAPIDATVLAKDLVREVAGNDRPLALPRRAQGRTYWFETLADERAIYCQINGIGTRTAENMSDFCKKLFQAVDDPAVEALIIDMRFNGGGDTFQNVSLVEGIIRSEKLRQPGHLFVIIGRDTFSAAQNTISELERRTKAILVGEPTGSSPNFIGESLNVPLPYSGWSLSVSDLWWQHSMAMDYRTWTPPTLYAPPTAAAFRAQVDPPLEVIRRYRQTLSATAK